MQNNIFNYDHISNTIHGFYDDELDITVLDNIVLAALQHRKKKQEFLLKETAEKAGRLLFSKATTLNEGLTLLGDTTSILFSNNIFSESEYRDNSYSLIKNIKSETDTTKIHYIDLYLRIVRRYMNVNVIYNAPADSTNTCKECGSELSDSIIVTNSGCEGCGMVMRKFIKSSANLDNDFGQESPITKLKNKQKLDKHNKSDGSVLFEKKLLRDQCRYSIFPTQEVVSSIRTYFLERNITPTLIESRRIDNIKLMRKILTALHYSKYKDDINYFCHEIWKFPNPDRSSLDKQILDDFNTIQPLITSALSTIQEKRDIVLVNAWRLWRHYIQAGLNLDPREFDIPKTKDIVNAYEEAWFESCKQLGWNIRYKLTQYLNEWYAVEETS